MVAFYRYICMTFVSRECLISLHNQVMQMSVSCQRKILALVRTGVFFAATALSMFCFFLDRLIMLMLCVLWERQSLTAMME